MSQPAPLVIDLQTGLLKTDLAREAFWRAASAGDVLNAARGAHDAWAEADQSELRALPLDGAIVEHMRRRRAEGARVVLVSEAPQVLASRFAEALDADEAIGGAPSGPARDKLLAERFAETGYEYVASRQRVVEVSSYARALRPHQWAKNLLVFLPMIAAHRFDGATLLWSLLAFVAFSLVASSVYILNDLLDLAADRAHPRKRNRPMASGAVPLDHAAIMGAVCLAGGFVVAIAAGPMFVLVLTAYTLLTTAYSLRLKREPVLDICVLAALYTLRIAAGSAATGIYLSVWLLAFAIFIFLSLAAIKRQTELVDNLAAGKEKPAGRGYRVGDLPIVEIMAVASGYVSVLVLALYVNTPKVVSLYGRPEFLWVVCAVLVYWISRAAMIAHRGEMDDDPVVFALRDRVSQICGLVALVALAAATWV